MKILITGGGGLIGSRIVEILAANKKYSIMAPSSNEFNITNSRIIEKYITDSKPDIILHSAAMTDVNKAEGERGDKSGSAWLINVDGAKNIALAAKSVKSFFIHISTDMVFSGAKEDKGPYDEFKNPEMDPDKLCWYGYTKAEAEKAVKTIFDNNLAIIRPSNPVRKKYVKKPDYIKKILNAYDQGKKISLFKDQYLTLTYIDEIAAVIEKIIGNKNNGIFHVSSTDIFTPFELGSYVLEKARGVKNFINAGAIELFLADLKHPARYPQYGGLKVEESQKRLDIKFNSWKETVDNILNKT